ncbi:3-oxoacyl-[acyl-carrier-protein] synthase II [Amycolatopsis sulphurea]|uniref:3-oxoacyl-[acyl-carrier-protein] synthase II n=1 Tax=Amycolatopsis sulphurea TaxID=76022 RepID=A0A2A9FEN9_9PSEU|nr:beta-ketoacyl synthase N-terminal-like domain-containing protein [Amycolatopsis sulphurea]PFG49917.1 3-oxoacyl-[acyl-carrier-protein] synthase II [Amycolatopsis sulphurea]
MNAAGGRPIIGTGAVAAIGGSPAEIFESLCAGKSGLAPMRGFDRSFYTGERLFEIDNRDGGDVSGRATAFLLDAITQALAEAGLDEQLGDIPVLVGTGLRELRSVELWARDGVPVSPGRLHFGTALRERFGATNTHTFSNACSASIYALALGTDLLASGAAETVVVAGVDAITESMVGMADRLQSVAPDTVRPFDRNRRGTILGEGASAIVVRRNENPSERGLGRVLGAAVNCDARHATAPDPANIATAIREAHERTGTAPEDIDLVMLHGTGTHANDAAEAEAMRTVFGAAPEKTLMTAMKSMTGHTSGASGVHSLIVALRAMTQSVVPPTIGLDDPIDDAAGFRVVRNSPEAANLALAQVNAFGFGGVNAVAIVAAGR